MKFLRTHFFVLFLLVHFLVWSLVPLLRQSLPMDSIEAVVWGKFCDWGTNKHPPLSGHLAYWFYELGASHSYAIYFLSQICVLLGFVYVYKLALFFMNKEKAALSAMLLEGVIYYGFSSVEYNVNVVSLFLWPATVYYFYKALQKGRFADWTLTGIFAGFNLFNKYVSGILLFCMFVYMFADPEARKKLKTFGPYWAGLVCVLLIMPHLVWLYDHEFFVLDYFIGRSGAQESQNVLIKHLLYPLKFAGAQFLFSLPALILYFAGTFKAQKSENSLSIQEKRFLFYLGLLPLCMMILISFVGGIKLKSMWGFPVLYMLGIILMCRFARVMTPKIQKSLIAGVYVVMFLFATAQICVITFNKSDKLHLDTSAYGLKAEELWKKHTNKEFRYVAGDVWWADNVALYAPSKPKPVIWGDIVKNPWFESKDFENAGALILTSDPGQYQIMAQKLGDVSEPQTLELEFKNLAGKIKRKVVWYGFYHI